MADGAKIQITNLNMQKSALLWLHGLKKYGLVMTWEKFRDDILERFRPSRFNDWLSKISRLQQTTSVASYINHFEELMNDI